MKILLRVFGGEDAYISNAILDVTESDLDRLIRLIDRVAEQREDPLEESLYSHTYFDSDMSWLECNLEVMNWEVVEGPGAVSWDKLNKYEEYEQPTDSNGWTATAVRVDVPTMVVCEDQVHWEANVCHTTLNMQTASITVRHLRKLKERLCQSSSPQK